MSCNCNEAIEWTSDGVRKLSDHDLSALLAEELELCYNSARISLLKAEVQRRGQAGTHDQVA